MSRSAPVIVLLIGLIRLVVPGTAAGQECAWSASAGLTIPATRDLRVEGHRTNLKLGWLGRLGHTCGSDTRRYGFDADAQRTYGSGDIYLFSLTGRLSRMFRDGSDPRIPWFELAGNAGFAYAFDPNDYVEIPVVPFVDRTPNRVIDLPGVGVTAGGGMRVGFPASPNGTFLLDVGFRATLLPNRKTNGPLPGTHRVLVTLPVALGYRLTL